MHRVVALAPRVGVGRRLGDPVALQQRVHVRRHRLAHGVDAHALEEPVGPLEVLGVLAVVLQEGQRPADRLRAGLHGHQQVALAHRPARRAADVDLPAALDGDQADVLDVGLRAVARAAGHRALDLVRRVQALHEALELDADGDRVAQAEAAEVGADAGLDRPHRLGVGVARRHAELLPDGRELLLAHAEQVDALAAGHLDQRHLVAFGDVGDPPQLGGRGHAAAHPRHDAEGPVALDVRVHAVVDEARVALLAVAVLADLRDEVGQPGLARAAVAAGAARRGQAGDRLHAPLAHDGGELLARLAPARAQVRGLLARAAALERQQLGDQGLARAAARARARDRDDLLRRAQPALADRAEDVALAHAVAVADLRGVGEVGRRGLARPGQ